MQLLFTPRLHFVCRLMTNKAFSYPQFWARKFVFERLRVSGQRPALISLYLNWGPLWPLAGKSKPGGRESYTFDRETVDYNRGRLS